MHKTLIVNTEICFLTSQCFTFQLQRKKNGLAVIFLLLQSEVSRDPLQHQPSSTSSQNRQCPGIGGFLGLGPEAVLSLPVLSKLLCLDRVGLGITLRLRRLILCVTTNVAKEGVVGDGAEENNGVQLSGAPEEEGEGEVYKGITKVTRDQC